MTAEVAVLNKSAIALAADSAMTVSGVGKIYPANKLFALTKHHPVGVMIYNNPVFMGVPWETLIKTFRQTLGTSSLPTCQDYAVRLVQHVWKHPVCTEQRAVENLLRIAEDIYSDIRQIAMEELNELVNKKRRWSSRDEGRVLGQAAEEKISALLEIRLSVSMKKTNVNKFISENMDEINSCIDEVFSLFRVTQKLRRTLHRVLRLTVQRDTKSGSNTGIVIAGFGEEEMFPQIVQIQTDGIIGTALKHELVIASDIGQMETPAYVYAFAQSDMAQMYMDGVHREYFDYIVRSAESAMVDFGVELLQKKGATASEIRATKESAKTLIEGLQEKARAYGQEKYTWPTLEMVSHLPKEELGELAEALVSLTSLRRRVSPVQETVGGPIDVAIISKGDGLIWHKRKHYFEPELNPSYFNRQSLELRQGEKDEQSTEKSDSTEPAASG